MGRGIDYKALLSTSLNVCGTGGKDVLVIPGRRLLPRLTPDLAEILRQFTKNVERSGFEGCASNIFAYKTFIKTQGGKHRLPRDILIIPWTLGPTPVLVLGHANGLPVCATPLSFDEKLYEPNLFKERLSGDVETLEVIGEHLIPCLDQYFLYIADCFRSLFFHQGKRYALHACRKIQERLSTSIDLKLNLIESDENCLSAQAEGVRRRIRRESENELLKYKAASSVARAIKDAIEYCLGVRDDYYTSVSTAQSMLTKVPDETPGLNDLRECLNFLSSTPQSDALGTLEDKYQAETAWGADLRKSAHFLSHVLGIIKDYGRDTLFVFTSYHMDVYASEEFYQQFGRFAKRELSPGHHTNITVFTGNGRQEHITLAILTKIWISDVHILYIPNSLAAFDKPEKVLQSHNDWVIEELYYGLLTGAYFHLVIAKDPRKMGERILDKLLRQIKTYEFGSIETLIKTDKFMETGKSLINGISRHIRSKIFTIHRPRQGSLCDDDKRKLRDAIFIPAFKNRMLNRIKAIRLGLSRDHGGVVQSIYAASLDKDTGRYNWTTISEVVVNFWGQRLDGHPVTEDWIRKVIRKQLVDLGITIGNTKVNVIEWERGLGRKKMVKFTLDKVIEVMLELYGLPASPSVLQNEFSHIITERNWQ